MTHAIKYLLVAFAFANTSAGADDLFSEITIGSVFAAPETVESDTSVKANSGRRLSGVHSIRKAMANVGFAEVSNAKPDELGGDVHRQGALNEKTIRSKCESRYRTTRRASC